MTEHKKESSRSNYEWHRERLLREKEKPNVYSNNRVMYNLNEIQSKHGEKAAYEAAKEFNSKKPKNRKYYT